MSEERVPDAVFIKRLPRISGKKSTKIELFQAGQFRDAWSLNLKDSFFPALPFRFEDRSLYWDAELYRVRLDGVWFSPKAGYTFLSWDEVTELLKVGK